MGIESVSGIGSSTNYQNQTTSFANQVSKDKPDTSVSDSLKESVKSDSGIKQVEEESSVKSREAISKDDAASMKQLKEIRKLLNNNTIAEFGYNDPTNRITIKIKDKDTDEVIKEIPSEQALEMLAKAWEIAGMLVDEKL